MRKPPPPLTHEEKLLAGPAAEAGDDPRRLNRIRSELRRAWKVLEPVGPAVSVFGSARTDPDDPDWEVARRTGLALGRAGWSVITGGSGGVMEAANLGAQQGGATSVGLTIDLPREEYANQHLDIEVRFHYFFTRKVCFVRYASAFVVFPGGLGTMDELFESLTLIQTEKIHSFPVILVGSEYWSGLISWMSDKMLASGKINQSDIDRLHICDQPSQIRRLLSSSPRAPQP